MRSLLIAPHDADLSILRTVLGREGLPATVSEDLGPGSQLADAQIDDFDAAVAVLPRAEEGLSAVLVETGIVLGRGLPLLLIVPPDTEPPPALSAIRFVRALLDNAEALRLHVGFFVRSLSEAQGKPADRPVRSAVLSPDVLDGFKSRLNALRKSSPQARGLAFENLIVDVFRRSGALVEQEHRVDKKTRVDAVAVIPGEEQRLGPLLIEVKLFDGAPKLQAAERQLQSYVLERGGGLGVLVYDSPVGDLPTQTTPLILSLRADVLLAELASRTLADVLVRARNEAIHRM